MSAREKWRSSQPYETVPKIPPTAITDAEFEKVLQSQDSSRARAAQMQHAARYHIIGFSNQNPSYARKMSERLEALFGYWTRHEAGLKVSGAGLSGAARTDGAPPAVHMFHAREGFAAAVATEAEVRVPARAAVLEREGEYASSHEATGRDAGGGASRPLLLERILGAKPGEERFRRDDLNAGSD